MKENELIISKIPNITKDQGLKYKFTSDKEVWVKAYNGVKYAYQEALKDKLKEGETITYYSKMGGIFEQIL
jgi:hypothetical protein